MIDHLVYAVADLAAGVADVEQRLGVSLTPGGAHPGLGTRNALCRIGEGVYLEVVGPDPDQHSPSAGLWLAEGAQPLPALMTWAARVDDLAALQRDAPLGLIGEIRSMSRAKPDGDTIAWTLTMPLRPLPAGGVVPFFIDWGDTTHPSESLPDVGLELVSLDGTHPDPDSVRSDLAALGASLPVVAGPPALAATIRTGAGATVLLT